MMSGAARDCTSHGQSAGDLSGRVADRLPRCKRAFTLVELIVVVAVIGVLGALLPPAVQAVRESARQKQCVNNLRQIASACLAHESAHRFFPTAGWGYEWAGQPNRGFGAAQPGGWLYNILPYMELNSLHDLGMNESDVVACRREYETRLATPVAAYYCPARRPPAAIRFNPPIRWAFRGCDAVGELNTPATARNDYAGSGGDFIWDEAYGATRSKMTAAKCDAWTRGEWASASGTYGTGVFVCHFNATTADIADGASNTLLAGEKFLDTDHYFSGLDGSDDGGWDSGHDPDTLRFSGLALDRQDSRGYADGCCQPLQDRPGYNGKFYTTTWGLEFGSAHPNGFNMAFCDGAVRPLSYSIDLKTLQLLGNRADKTPVDVNKL